MAVAVVEKWPLWRVSRLQNSPYFYVFKYARAVKQKVRYETENRERDWGETLKIRTVSSHYPRRIHCCPVYTKRQHIIAYCGHGSSKWPS